MEGEKQATPEGSQQKATDAEEEPNAKMEIQGGQEEPDQNGWETPRHKRGLRSPPHSYTNQKREPVFLKALCKVVKNLSLSRGPSGRQAPFLVGVATTAPPHCFMGFLIVSLNVRILLKKENGTKYAMPGLAISKYYLQECGL